MCHLCHKVAALQELDSKSIKPIYVLLAKAHKHADMGDFWMVRLQHILKLRNLLEGLPQISPVKSLLERVDQEMQHVRKNMAVHPVLHGSGRIHELKTNLSPSDSVSVEIRRERELLEKRAKAEGGELRRKGEEEAESPELFDKSGSDLDPPAGLILQSIRKVDAWMEDCNDAISEAEWRDYDNPSMVSAIDGGVVERPRVDPAAVWRQASKQSRTSSKNSSKSSARVVSNIKESVPYKVPDMKLSDWVFPNPKGGFKMGIRRAISIKKGNPETDLGLDNKIEKPSPSCMSIKGGIRVLRDRVLGKESKSVTRGKSPTESIRRILKTRYFEQ